MKTLFVRLLTFLGIIKKKEQIGARDAIQMPMHGNNSVVEDFEMAAFHNQA